MIQKQMKHLCKKIKNHFNQNYKNKNKEKKKKMMKIYKMKVLKNIHIL